MANADAATNGVFPAIVRQLVADSARYFPGCGSAKAATTRVTRNPYSNTARISLDFASGPKHLFAKVPVVDRHNRDVVHERLKNEFEIMQALSSEMGSDEGICVVEPVAYFPQWPALVTVEVEGATLQQRLSGGTRLLNTSGSRLELGAYCKLAGRWLRRFQAITLVDGHTDFRIQPVLDYCAIRIDQLSRGTESGIDSRFAGHFNDHLLRLASAVPAGGARFAGRHNDFAPHNMIATERKIHVLDFTMYDRAETCFDAVNFWERLESMKADPLHSRATLTALQRAFLEGYGESFDSADPQIRIARCQIRLTKMASMSGRAPANLLRRWQHNRLLRSYRDWIETEIASPV